jgi:hypothetical protein
MRDTLLCELLRRGGMSPARAAVLERWINDKTPAGLTGEVLYTCIRRSVEQDLIALGRENVALADELRKREMDSIFACVPQRAGY